MSRYKRIYLPNNSYFFTVVTANRKPLFVEDKNVQLLKSAFRYVQSRKPFKIEAKYVFYLTICTVSGQCRMIVITLYVGK